MLKITEGRPLPPSPTSTASLDEPFAEASCRVVLLALLHGLGKGTSKAASPHPPSQEYLIFKSLSTATRRDFNTIKDLKSYSMRGALSSV